MSQHSMRRGRVGKRSRSCSSRSRSCTSSFWRRFSAKAWRALSLAIASRSTRWPRAGDDERHLVAGLLGRATRPRPARPRARWAGRSRRAPARPALAPPPPPRSRCRLPPRCPAPGPGRATRRSAAPGTRPTISSSGISACLMENVPTSASLPARTCRSASSTSSPSRYKPRTSRSTSSIVTTRCSSRTLSMARSWSRYTAASSKRMSRAACFIRASSSRDSSSCRPSRNFDDRVDLLGVPGARRPAARRAPGSA